MPENSHDVPHVYARLIAMTGGGNFGDYFELSDGTTFNLPPSAFVTTDKLRLGDFFLIDLQKWKGAKLADVWVFRSRDDSSTGLVHVTTFGIGERCEPTFPKRILET